MKPSLSSACLAVVLSSVSFACATPPARVDDHTIARTTATGRIEGRPTLGMPIALPIEAWAACHR